MTGICPPEGDRPGASAPGLARPADWDRFAADVRTFVDAVSAALVPALQAAVDAINEFADALPALLGVNTLAAARQMLNTAEYLAPVLGPDYAVAHLGLTAADVRSCDGQVVRLWNRRVVPLGDGFGPWLLAETGRMLGHAAPRS